MSKIPQPIPYQGSKRHIAHHILPLFSDKPDKLVEPFAGSAAISVAAALPLIFFIKETPLRIYSASDP